MSYINVPGLHLEKPTRMQTKQNQTFIKIEPTKNKKKREKQRNTGSVREVGEGGGSNQCRRRPARGAGALHHRLHQCDQHHRDHHAHVDYHDHNCHQDLILKVICSSG